MRTADENNRAQVAYDMAYFVLPPRAHNDIKELRADFEDSPDLGALSYYAQAAKARGVVPDAEDVRALRGHTGELDDCDLIVVEYPRFPAVDLLARLSDGAPLDGSYVLAPYFSAVVIDRGSDEVRCFVLGQSPDARTTLRLVSPEMNANLGDGCEPEMDAFLKLLQLRVRR